MNDWSYINKWMLGHQGGWSRPYIIYDWCIYYWCYCKRQENIYLLLWSLTNIPTVFYPCIKFLYLGLIALIYLRTKPIPTLAYRQICKTSRGSTKLSKASYWPHGIIRSLRYYRKFRMECTEPFDSLQYYPEFRIEYTEPFDSLRIHARLCIGDTEPLESLRIHPRFRIEYAKPCDGLRIYSMFCIEYTNPLESLRMHAEFCIEYTKSAVNSRN